MKALFVTIIAIILSFAASVADVYWLAAAAGVVALLGAYVQYRDTVPFEFVFSPVDWQKDASDYRLVIHQRQHKKRSPTATVYVGETPNFEVAMCDIHADADGTVVLRVSQVVKGKVVIK